MTMAGGPSSKSMKEAFSNNVTSGLGRLGVLSELVLELDGMMSLEVIDVRCEEIGCTGDTRYLGGFGQKMDTLDFIFAFWSKPPATTADVELFCFCLQNKVQFWTWYGGIGVYVSDSVHCSPSDNVDDTGIRG